MGRMLYQRAIESGEPCRDYPLSFSVFECNQRHIGRSALPDFLAISFAIISSLVPIFELLIRAEISAFSGAANCNN